MDKETLIFTNYYSFGTWLHIRYLIFEDAKDTGIYADESLVPAGEVNSEYRDLTKMWWADTKNSLREYFAGGTFIVLGQARHGKECCHGGFIFTSFDELTKLWDGYEKIKIYDRNGHLYIECATHKNGSACFEIKRLTDAGLAYANKRWGYKYPVQELHDTLWHSSRYTHLPYVAASIYPSHTEHKRVAA